VEAVDFAMFIPDSYAALSLELEWVEIVMFEVPRPSSPSK
jgi:hypothetical protein